MGGDCPREPVLFIPGTMVLQTMKESHRLAKATTIGLDTCPSSTIIKRMRQRPAHDDRCAVGQYAGYLSRKMKMLSGDSEDKGLLFFSEKDPTGPILRNWEGRHPRIGSHSTVGIMIYDTNTMPFCSMLASQIRVLVKISMLSKGR